jgi:hypothetical protein
MNQDRSNGKSLSNSILVNRKIIFAVAVCFLNRNSLKLEKEKFAGCSKMLRCKAGEALEVRRIFAYAATP